MTKKMLMAPILVLTLALTLAFAGPAPAQQAGSGNPGKNWNCGQGRGWSSGPMAQFNQDNAGLRDQLRQKTREVMNLFAQPQVDEAKAKGLNQEITKLRNELSGKRLEYMLEYKKRNPDWRPRFGDGRGYHGNRRGKGNRGGGGPMNY
ncbi:MAG: hypothetical protein SV487_12520 [Thermodesulfobacteriota bacterium]|nr:hypothetical protein [Thermodesulfobacteriota bacterium]